MDVIQEKNLKTFNLNELDTVLENIKPCTYCLGINAYVLIRRLNSSQRKIVQSIFNECKSYIEKVKEFKDYTKITKGVSYSDSLVSSLVCLATNMDIDASPIEVKYGICTLILAMQDNQKRELNSIKKILFFNIELKKYTNKKLINIYKKTIRDYSGISTLYLDDDKKYSIEFDRNEKLLIQRKDIIEEFKKRSYISKYCEIVDEYDIYKGHAYFIPKFSTDDIIVVFYKHIPYTISAFKKTKLHTKKKDDKIYWK